MQKTTQHLLDAAREIWAAYNRHPFVLGIEDGSLDREKFRYYILQDYLYLEEYAKVFSIGVAKAGSLETMQLFSRYVTLLTQGEMDIHRGYLGRLEVTASQLAQTPRALDNLSYTSYMLRVAYEEGEIEILSAILSCAYSYEQIAQTILEHNPCAARHPFYGQWVQGYAAPTYHQANLLLLDTLDRLSQNLPPARLHHITDIFLTCSRYELAFWDMAWNQAAGPRLRL